MFSALMFSVLKNTVKHGIKWNVFSAENWKHQFFYLFKKLFPKCRLKTKFIFEESNITFFFQPKLDYSNPWNRLKMHPFFDFFCLTSRWLTVFSKFKIFLIFFTLIWIFRIKFDLIWNERSQSFPEIGICFTHWKENTLDIGKTSNYL